MDSTYSLQSYDGTYSHIPRSRASSTGVSTTEGLFQNLQLAESPSVETAPYTNSSRPASSRGLPSPLYLSPSLSHHSSNNLSHPLPQTQHEPTSYPSLSSDHISDADWFETEHPPARGAPLLRLEPAIDARDRPASSPLLASIEPEAMSTVALQYDPGFSMGSRSSFTWPAVMDSGSGLLPPDMGHYGSSEASLSPPSASRSVTASPPRSTLTPEQRELKRQRDQYRHNTKLQARGRRAGSGSDPMYSPPVTLADLSTGTSSMPIYTTAPPQMPLMPEPQAPQYLPPFSPQLPDQSQTGMFSSPYPPPSYMPNYDYQTSAPPSLPSHYGSRPPIMTDPSMGMYPGPSMMGQAHQDANGQVRVVHSRPKPQCWEHGCNGRQFSTFSNLLRHQREKSGQATKATCPNCGAEFTRTTARNGHLQHDKCKKKPRD